MWSELISQSQWLSAYNLSSNHQIALIFVLLYNWLQAKKSVGVTTLVTVATFVPNNLVVNR